MAPAPMSITLAMMMAVRRAMCEQTLTEQEDSFFAELRLPDIITSVQERKPKSFLAPSWSEVNAAEAETRSEFSARRARYYMSMIVFTVIVTVAAGVGILSANHTVQQRCRATSYAPLASPPTHRGRILRKARVSVLFLGHVAALTWCMLTATQSGELTPKLGLSWELWWSLAAAGCVWAIVQALWAVLTCRATARKFSAATFPTALAVYMCPVISDGFDMTKDVAFIGTLLSLQGTWLHVLGVMCLIWLVGLYLCMIWTDDESEDAVLMTFASVAAALDKQVAEQALAAGVQVADQAPGDEEQPQAATASWFSMRGACHALEASMQSAKEKGLVIAFFQTTRQKRRVLLLEDGVQGVCAVVTIVGTGASIKSFFFIFIMNIALPACKWVFAWAFHPFIAEKLREWLLDEAEVARNAGLTARFQSLVTKLQDIMELNVQSEEWFPPVNPDMEILVEDEVREVTDSHARLVAWSLKDGKERKWLIKNRTCHIGTKGWEALMASDASQDTGLRTLVLDRVWDLQMDTLLAAMAAKDSSLRELGIKNFNIGDAGAQALANAISKEECGLTHLDLENIGMRQPGASAIANAIGPKDRFQNLRAMLIDISQLNVKSDEMWFPGSTPVTDGHAYLVAWTLKDSAVRKFVIKERPCHISRNGWETLTVTVKSAQDTRLKQLVLNQVSDLNTDALAAAILAKESGLVHMYIANSGLGNDGAASLAGSIRSRDCSLRELHLEHNDIGDAGAEALANAIAKQECRLTLLALGGNSIRADGAAALVNALTIQECDLTHLDLTNNSIGDEGASAIANILGRQDGSLRELGLENNNIGAAGAQALSMALAKKECGLTLLALEGNDIGVDGAAALANAIGMQESRLLELKLGHDVVSAAGVQAFETAMARKDRFHLLRAQLINITQLHVDPMGIWFSGYTPVTDGHAQLVASSLKDCDARRWIIKWRPCHVSQKGWEALMVATDVKLEKLDLGRVEDLNIDALVAVMVNKDCSLRALDLSHNKLGVAEAKLFADAISKQECGLTHLHISYNKIGKEGVAAIADAVSHKESSLQVLGLNQNHLGIDGVEALHDKLFVSEQECSLRELKLRNNKIGGEAALLLGDIIKRKECNLHFLDLSGHPRSTDSNGLSEAFKSMLVGLAKPQLKLLV